jgi:hypothetical protein
MTVLVASRMATAALDEARRTGAEQLARVLCGQGSCRAPVGRIYDTEHGPLLWGWEMLQRPVTVHVPDEIGPDVHVRPGSEHLVAKGPGTHVDRPAMPPLEFARLLHREATGGPPVEFGCRDHGPFKFDHKRVVDGLRRGEKVLYAAPSRGG